VTWLCISGKLRCDVIHNRASTKIYRELILALESARMRLAVAIALETKSTPPDRRWYYMETSDRMRRFIKSLRKRGSDVLQERQAYIQALDALNRVPVHSKAFLLCQLLCDIVAGLAIDE
jgi:chromatin segregation and condensation protein Rec8/ScpA/Scc1 (kleisin family)